MLAEGNFSPFSVFPLWPPVLFGSLGICSITVRRISISSLSLGWGDS